MAKQIPQNGDMSQLLGPGENSFGFVSYNGNGTLINGHGGDGSSRPWSNANGERWSADPRIGILDYPSMGMPVHGADAGAPPGGAYDTGATLPRRVKRK